MIIDSERVAPDWAQLPEWANWWAVDACGIAWAYAEKPHVVLEDNFWFASNGETEQLDFVDFDGREWTDTLAARYGEVL